MKFRTVAGACALGIAWGVLGVCAQSAEAKTSEVKIEAPPAQDQAGQKLEVVSEGGNENQFSQAEAVQEKKPEEREKASLKNEGMLFTDAALSEAEVGLLKTGLLLPVHVSADKAQAEAYGVPFPGVYYTSEEKEFVHDVLKEGGEALIADVKKKVAQDVIPAFREITELNFKEYEDTGLPTAYVVSYGKEIEKFSWVESVGASFKKEINVALLDYSKTEFFLNSAGITSEMVPCLFILSDKDNAIVKYVQQDVKEESSFRAFLAGFLDGSLAPYVMSEPLPAENEKENEFGVQKLVMHNFKEKVMDPLKDVLVVYHVTWCGFCRKFLPELDKLSKALKDAGVENVSVGKILMSANDVPLDVQVDTIKAFPTIRLYKKGTNEEVEYTNQSRPADAELILEFLKEHADVSADLKIVQASKEASAPAKEELKVDL
ncbi:protein disulfide-isomerase A1 [Nematocida sp. AWRm77]|nr:protein disulfide-isomerase A1 [Nematocida sp. AWRm77]